MVKLMEFLVMDPSGIPLFHSKKKGVESVDKNLIASFLSTFQMMLKQGADQKLEMMKFKDSNLVFEHREAPFSIFFVGRARSKEKEKNIRSALDKLGEQFIKQYWQHLDGWKGNIEVFLDFEKHIESYW